MSFIFILLGGVYLFLYLRFQRSSYRSVSNNSFLKTFINKGFWGEYRIFATLEKLAKPHHIFTNLYIPRKDGTTTEIDLIYLS
ncbi:NERD domain-containing protein, partial [Enterococcus cecorum]